MEILDRPKVLRLIDVAMELQMWVMGDVYDPQFDVRNMVVVCSFTGAVEVFPDTTKAMRYLYRNGVFNFLRYYFENPLSATRGNLSNLISHDGRKSSSKN